jgi:hypothetical protein
MSFSRARLIIRSTRSAMQLSSHLIMPGRTDPTSNPYYGLDVIVPETSTSITIQRAHGPQQAQARAGHLFAVVGRPPLVAGVPGAAAAAAASAAAAAAAAAASRLHRLATGASRSRRFAFIYNRRFCELTRCIRALVR